MSKKLLLNKQCFWDLETSGAGKKEHPKSFESTPKWEQILQIAAIIVDEKLKHIDKWNENRNVVVDRYNQNINNDNLLLPVKADYCNFHVYHIYCVRVINGKREQFQSYLKENGITTVIHYPIPIESTGAYSYLNVFNENTRKWADEIISLPIHPFMKDEEVDFICHSINNWES